ncbi:MAG: NAD(P)/FAD-dependent oxidoreductase [Myxococcota bacterium]
MAVSAAQTRHRVNSTPAAAVDVAIIGAGPGGLTAGAYLARHGLKVAIFDGHYVAGGSATMFRRVRDKTEYHFDIGLHYIGDCGEDGAIPRLLRGVGVEMAFLPLDEDGFDTLLFPDLTFAVPVGRERFRDRLVEQFPSERRGIDRYIRFIKEIDEYISTIEKRGAKMTAGLLLHVLMKGRLLARYQNQTLDVLLDSCTKNPKLRAVLAGQNGDYGLPPGKVSSVLHGGLVNHYLRGAYYPRGGGQEIADRLAETIEAAGGSIHLRHRVTRIEVENNRAAGVTVQPHRGESMTVRADVVLSNADITATMMQLLGPEHLPRKWVERVSSFEMPPGIFMTCLAVDGPINGMKRCNYWKFDTYDFNELYASLTEGPPKARCAYITSASMKDPDTALHGPPGRTNVEVMTVLDGRTTRWGATPEQVMDGGYRKNNRYQALKAQIEASLIGELESVFPGTADRIVFQESATPVTHSRYTAAKDGTSYGLSATPSQFLKNRPGYRGPVADLFLCGASTRAGHGIVGAMRSGYEAAKRIVRRFDTDPLPKLS